MSTFPYVKQNITKIIDNEEDLGEVAEWVEKSAAQKHDDDDFDVVVPRQSAQVELMRKKINDKLANGMPPRRSGPIVNNLKEKAMMVALQNQSVSRTEKTDKATRDVIHFDSDEEPVEEQGRVFVLAIEEPMDIPMQAVFELPKTKEQTKQVVFIEAWDELKSAQEMRASIQFLEKKPSFVAKLFGCFTVHLKNSRLIEEKNQVCVLTHMQFDDTNPMHFQVLYTVFCQFMDTDYCLRYGNHWVNVGFQGRDPATDLRGAGMLGLLQILAFLQHYRVYIKECLKYAQLNNFPLSITLINISTFALIALKDNKLNALINKEESVISVVNKLYFGGFYQFFKQHKEQQGNFHTIGNTLAQVRRSMYETPEKVIADFQRGITLYYKSIN